MKIKPLSCVVALGLLLAATAAPAQVVYSDPAVDPSAPGGAMAVDLVIARPLGLAATVLGTALFIVQLPLDLIQWQSPAAPARKLIGEPAKFTFSRPLGDFN